MRFAPMLSVAVLIAGCTTGPRMTHDPDAPSADAQECKGTSVGPNNADCSILVNIAVTGTQCSVNVQADQDKVSFARGARDKWIVWQIDQSPGGYRFPQGGISFVDDHRGNFSRGNPTHGGLAYQVKNRNGGGDTGEYKYTIKVQNKSGTVTCERDPKIINE